MDATRSLLVLGLLTAGVGVSADLRMASQPKNAYKVQQRNAVQFVSKTALYMEPSDFGYQGLKAQRDGGAYDQFLRSNIDNEQDKRNFNTEVGQDMLPVRSLQAAETDASGSVKNKIPDGAPGPAIVATPGTPYIIPLRWNNPHASELEVNVWIQDMKYVVPVRKPTCSGEGHQDNVFAFTIPADFNQLGAKVPGFKGCKAEGDCVLQIYAHSVEPRTYAIGTPLIVNGDVPAATATDTSAIAPAGVDPGTDLSKQPSDLCLPSNSPAADITSAQPRMARLISDQYNHAYQNSDYSPYSGQQPEAISRNMQAAVIISMIPGNRGELGNALLKKQNPAAAALQAKLAAKVQNLVTKYEAVVNNIIAKVGDKSMKTTDTVGAGGVQKLATKFRAAETGSTTTTRLTTNTYVPSFQLETQAQITAAKALVPAKYAGLITPQGTVKLYEAVLNDMKGEFNKAAALGLEYQGPAVKTTTTTMQDATQFRKIDANGKKDGGIYAATKAQEARKAQAKVQDKFVVSPTPMLATLEAGDELPDPEAEPTPEERDMHALTADKWCDDDAMLEEYKGLPCEGLGVTMFSADADGVLVAQEVPKAMPNSAYATTAATSIATLALSAIAAIFLA